MKYLIQQWIAELHQREHCPRLMVDATVKGVEVPERVKREWGEAMPIDLDPSFPLELDMSGDGVHCVLSFGGPFPCYFPWRSIYVVQDRDSQLGMVIEENLPDRFAAALDEHGEAARQSSRERAPAPQGDLAEAESDSPADDPEPTGWLRPVLQVVDSAEAGGLEVVDSAEVEAEAAEDAGEAARVSSGRPAFKVIDGGKSG